MEENMEEGQNSKGCFECCVKCLGVLPYASLFATILLYAGVALFCGCGHEALSGTATILQNYFEVVRAPVETLDVLTMIDILKYVIYGVAAAFFVYGILLMVEGFFTTGAIRDLYGDFKITACGRCVSAWFIMLTYIFFLAWLGVTAFTSLPVFMYFNIWTLCQNTTVVEGANLCLDLRQFGMVTIGEERKVCTGSEKFFKMCESNELDMTFHLFVCALAGAGAAVIAMNLCSRCSGWLITDTSLPPSGEKSYCRNTSGSGAQRSRRLFQSFFFHLVPNERDPESNNCFSPFLFLSGLMRNRRQLPRSLSVTMSS
uniref:Neuronal membrane glycoprotein M6-a n=1 Tax=Oncorhynchus tshawytscha TaxID=74940 RepID=A0AAZ3QHB4_ONCTS